jgi:hypothetical protein
MLLMCIQINVGALQVVKSIFLLIDKKIAGNTFAGNMRGGGGDLKETQQ